MNGDLTELFEAIKHWSKEIHEQRHRENLTKFDKLFSKLDTLIALKGDVRWLTWSVRILWIVLIVGALIRGTLLMNGVIK